MKKRVEELINKKFIEVIDFDVGSEIYNLYIKLHRGYLFDKEMGRGEAAAIALAVENDGILASNNTKDVVKAVEKYNLIRIKTGDILVKAYNYGIISEKEGNELWKKMLKQNRCLTEKSFTDYRKKNPDTIF